jgi:hypothetical protein
MVASVPADARLCSFYTLADGRHRLEDHGRIEQEPGPERAAPRLLTRDEARRIAAIFAKLPELLGVNWVVAGTSYARQSV